MNKETVRAALIFMLAGLLCGFALGYGLFKSGEAVLVECDTVTVTKTTAYREPAAADSVPVKHVTRYLPIVKRDTLISHTTDTFFREIYAQNTGENIPPQGLSDESDSAAVVIPITQKRYEGEDYLAYVSGYEPFLDSIFVFPKTTTIRERKYKPPNKWHIGITGGYGYGFNSKQAEPYIGIGITYSILCF